MTQKPNYWDYIQVEDLLSLQGGLSGDDNALSNDEVRFIAIHQIDELWFKLVLRELASTRDVFRSSSVPETSLAAVTTSLKRVSIIFQLAGRHFRLMETMRTQDYLKFRDKLSPASGFQSAQFREIEILLGLDNTERIPLGLEKDYTAAMVGDDQETAAMKRVRLRLEDKPTLKDAVYAWLYRTPIHGSSPDQPGDEAVVRDFIDEFLGCHENSMQDLIRTSLRAQALTEPDEERLRKRYGKELTSARDYLTATEAKDPDEKRHLQRMRAAILFIDSNRQLPLLSWPSEIVDSLIEVEQAFLVFRQRHARMVERVIGRRVGTGGSDGVEYLDQTALAYRVFKEIWAARTLLLEPALAPTVKNPDFYALRNP